MENKNYTPPAFAKNKWFRLGFSIILALSFALVLLLLPISARTSVLSNGMSLPLPFGAEVVYATGGLTITKLAPATVNQGDILTYSVRATNNTGQNLTQAIITDTTPANTTCNAAQGSASPSWAGACGTGGAGWVLVYSPPIFPTPFANNTTSVVTLSTIVAQPLPDQSLIINNSYGISATGSSTFTDFGSPITTVVNAPNWQISKTAFPTTVQPGDPLTYTLTVTNNGHLVTTGTYTITDQIPLNTNYVSGSASPAATFDGTSLTWTSSTPLNIDEAITFSYVVTVTEPLTNNTQIVNQTYNVSGGNVFSPAAGSPVTVTVIAPVTLTLTKSDTPDPVQAGDLIDYTIIITNDTTSKGAAGNVVVTDTIPANTTLVNAGFTGPANGVTATLGSVVTWTLTTPDPLPVGQEAALFLRVQVTSPLTNGTVITNDTYSATASNDIVTVVGQPVVTTTVESTPTLEIFKQGLPATVNAGGQITYTIRYTNSGNANATNVLISDTFPISTSYAADTSSPNVSPGTTTANGIFWTIPTVAGENGGGIITLTLNVLSPQTPGTVLTNVISMESSEIVTPVLFTATNTISSTPNLHIQKTADPNPVAAGSILTYTIVYSNNGNADATGVTITDTLDGRVTFNGASNGGTFAGGLVTWTGLTVPADGLDRTLLMSVTVASTLTNNTILNNSVIIADASITATDTVTTLVQAPSLAITKVVSPTGVVRAGDTIEYTISYTNTGAITITTPGILITDTFPVSVTNIISSSTAAAFVSAAPPEYIWSDNNIPPNGGGTIIISGQVITSPWASTGGQISNSVIVAGSGYSATDTVNVQGQPGLPFTITVTAVPPTTQVGNNILTGAIVQDVYGNNVFNGTPITLTSSLAGSQLNGSAPPIVLNTSNGNVSANLSSTVPGTTTVAAQATGASGTLTSTTVATFTPGAVVGFLLQATSPQTAGVAFPITITAVDNFGNTVNTVNQAITISDSTGTIAPTAVTLVNGFTTTNFIVTQATSPALDTITAISGTITGTVGVEIRPNVPTTLTVTANPTSIQVCQTANVTTSLTDAFNNPIPNKAVNLAIIPGATTDFSPNPGNTNSAGIFTSILTGRTPAGPASIQATTTAPALLGTANINIANPPVPTTLNFTVTPNPLATGGNTALATATVTDCFGPSANQVVTFTVSNPALAFFAANPITGTTNASGVATATLTSNSIPQDGTVVVTATVGSLNQTVNVVLQTAALTITKTANPASGTEVRPGQIINYILQITNTGTGAANNVVITDVLPTGVSFSSCVSVASCAGGSTTTVTTPTLGAGQSFSANIQVTVTAPTSGTIISNNATARSTQTSLITSNLVSHAVTTATVDIFLPIILRDFVNGSDLIITSLNVSGTNPNRVVTLVVQNIGNASTDEGFWVDFYVNPTTLPNTPSLLGDRRWNRVGSSQGIAWQVPALAAGASVTLTSDGSVGIGPSTQQTSWNGSLPAGASVYGFADSFDLENAPFVEIEETNEGNNMSGPQIFSSAAGELNSAPDTPAEPAQIPPRGNP